MTTGGSNYQQPALERCERRGREEELALVLESDSRVDAAVGACEPRGAKGGNWLLVLEASDLRCCIEASRNRHRATVALLG